MARTRLVATLLVVVLAATGCLADERPVDYVRPHIDTAKSRWFYFSSACRPFGMVNLSPDTAVKGDWQAGYLYDEPYIRCFSHIHGWQLSGIPVMPGVGDVKAAEGLEANKAAFSHDDEIVAPGYHKVFLRDRDIQVELTSTHRVGFHRYRFPAADKSHIAFSLDQRLGPAAMESSSVRRISDREFEGSVTMAPTSRRKKPFTAYFVAQINRPFTHIMAWEKANVIPLEQVTADKIGFYVQFPTRRDEIVLMKVALSYVSTSQARKNLEAELNHWDFDRVVKESQAEWNDWLGRIEIAGGSEKQRIKFYTDLWHALQGRRIVSDVDGRYTDNTGPQPRTRRVRLDAKGQPLYPHYNFDAWWGSQWSLNILWSLVYPELMDNFCNSMLDMYDNGGLIPRGPSGGNYTYVMIGDQAAPFFACAWARRIRNWDVEKAYEGLRKNAFPGGIRDRAGYEDGPDPAGGGMRYYIERGYIPLHDEGKGLHREGAAQSLEYAYSDWCLAQLAQSLGKTADEALFMQRSANYHHIFDPDAGKTLDPQLGFAPASGWMRPREKDGSWYKDFYPVGSDEFNARGFVESNSAIYTWFVPQDIAGLAALMGGNEAAIAKLHRQFELAAPHRFVAQHGKHAVSWVDYENQPSTHLAHIFNHLGAPSLSQYWVRRVKEETFGDITPHGGYNGDEDQGQMGALGVLMAIGLFDIQGGAAGDSAYDITAPLFDKITIHLNKRYYPGDTFTILCRNLNPDNIFIQSAAFNEKPQNHFRLHHRHLIQGGTLELYLGANPSPWSQSASLPASIIESISPKDPANSDSPPPQN